MENISDKTFSVQEAANLLGVSEITVRRRIQDNKLTAVMDSKKNGYRITGQSLLNYAKSHKTKLDSAFQSQNVGLASLPVFPFLPLGLLGLVADSQFTDTSSEEKFLNNPTVIDKFIQRLNVELEDFDSQIKLLQFKISHSVSDSEKIKIEEKILTLQNDKIKIKKSLSDLEIQKAVLSEDV